MSDRCCHEDYYPATRTDPECGECKLERPEYPECDDCPEQYGAYDAAVDNAERRMDE